MWKFKQVFDRFHEFPLPIIPGCDSVGVVEEVGAAVAGFSKGDEVVVSPGTACYRCDQCLTGNHSLCRYYGIMGETRDGGDAEFVRCPGVNLIPKP